MFTAVGNNSLLDDKFHTQVLEVTLEKKKASESRERERERKRERWRERERERGREEREREKERGGREKTNYFLHKNKYKS